jgi:formate dehydrogenase iron-sulfur subunit
MAGEKSILIDSSKCCGCGSCYFSCKAWNLLPASGGSRITDGSFSVVSDIRPQNWLIIERSTINGHLRALPLMCHHCSDAPCVKHCPANALSYNNGWVVVNSDLCIGCGACTTVCPYGAVSVYRADSREPLKKNTAYKCDGCTANYSDKPACVISCPTGAIEYGNRSRLIRKALRRVDKLRESYPQANLSGITEHKGENVLIIRMDSVLKNSKDIGHELMRVKSLYKTVSIFMRSCSAVSGHLYGFLHFIVTGKKIG